jgi:hypothetical protein
MYSFLGPVFGDYFLALSHCDLHKFPTIDVTIDGADEVASPGI